MKIQTAAPPHGLLTAALALFVSGTAAGPTLSAVSPEWTAAEKEMSFKQLPDRTQLQKIDRPLYDSLRRLDQDLLSQQLRPYLTRPELRALLTRRDLLVDFFGADPSRILPARSPNQSQTPDHLGFEPRV